jgi:hypothetical protein
MLACFREVLEDELGHPLGEPTLLDAALLLDDLCSFLGFNPSQRAVVMGARVAEYVKRVNE